MFAIVDCTNCANANTIYNTHSTLLACLPTSLTSCLQTRMFNLLLQANRCLSPCVHNSVSMVLIVLITMNSISFPFDAIDQFIFAAENVYGYIFFKTSI